MSSLPEGFVQLVNLQKLTLYDCKNLRSLPEGIIILNLMSTKN